MSKVPLTNEGETCVTVLGCLPIVCVSISLVHPIGSGSSALSHHSNLSEEVLSLLQDQVLLLAVSITARKKLSPEGIPVLGRLGEGDVQRKTAANVQASPSCPKILRTQSISLPRIGNIVTVTETESISKKNEFEKCCGQATCPESCHLAVKPFPPALGRKTHVQALTEDDNV